MRDDIEAPKPKIRTQTSTSVPLYIFNVAETIVSFRGPTLVSCEIAPVQFYENKIEIIWCDNSYMSISNHLHN